MDYAINDNLLDFGFGFAKFIDNSFILEAYKPPAHFPIVSLSNMIPLNRNVWFLPPAIANDEVFTYLSPFCVNNTLNRYIVSNYGRVYDRICNRFVPYRYNKKYSSDGATTGYSQMHIAYFESPTKMSSIDVYVHRAVMMSFNYIPGCEHLEVNHLDGIHLNNNINNLEWVTPEENVKHSIDNKLKTMAGDNIGKTNIISSNDAEEICKLYSCNNNIDSISNILKIQKHTVFNVLSGVVFREVSMKYNISVVSNTSIPIHSLEIICQLISEAIPLSDISAKTGVSKYELLDIRNRKIYTNISYKYDFSRSLDIDNFRRTLSSSEVHEICRRLQCGEYPQTIADDMDIAVYIIANIKCGNTYKEISAGYTFCRVYNDNIDDHIVNSICLDMQNGMRNVDIANKYNISVITIGHIRRGETYREISSNYNIPKSDELQKGELSNDIVHQICKKLADGENPTKVAQDVGVEVSKVNGIKSGTCYRFISSQYTFPKLTNVVTDDQVITACKGLQNGDRTGKILKDANISKRTLYRIRDRVKYTDISKDYNW